MRLNVINEYTYTLETIVQAGRSKMAMISVPINTNAELRPSRLFNSMFGYVKKSIPTILRAFLMYKPLKFFCTIGMMSIFIGFLIGLRFIVFYLKGRGDGNIQSLILSSMLIGVGVQSFIIGLQADIIAANRKILEDIQYKVRKIYYDSK